MIKYAEHIIHQKILSMSQNFEPNVSRSYLAAQLYKHGCEKLIEGYDTDIDIVPCSVRMQGKLKGIVLNE